MDTALNDEKELFIQKVESWGAFCPQGREKLLSPIPFEEGELPFFKTFDLSDYQEFGLLFIEGLPKTKRDLTFLLKWKEKVKKGKICFLSSSKEVFYHFFQSSFSDYFLSLKDFYVYYVDPDQIYEDSLRLAQFFGLKKECFLGDSPFFEQLKRGYMVTKEAFLVPFIEYMKGGLPFFENFYRNLFLLENVTFLNTLKETFKGVPAVIVGAGPSLEKNFQLLKDLEDKALVFAGGTAFTALEGFNVNPHFGLGVDPNIFQWTRIIQNNSVDVPFFFVNRFLHLALSHLQSPLIYSAGSAFLGLNLFVDNQLKIEQEEKVDMGRSVVNFAVSIAEFLGCNPIVFVGVDLSYPEGKGYASSIQSHPLHGFKDHFHTKRVGEGFIERKDIYGNRIITLSKWLLESEWIGAFQIEHPETALINATEGGIGFYNVPNIPLEEVVEKYFQGSFDLRNMIHKSLQEGKRSLSSEEIKGLLNNLLRSFEKTEEILEKALQEKKEDFIPLIQDQLVYPLYLKDIWNVFFKYSIENFEILEGNFLKEEEKIKERGDLLFFGLENLLKIVKEQKKLITEVLIEKGEKHFTRSGKSKNVVFQKEEKTIPAEGEKVFFSSEGIPLVKTEYKEGKKEGKESLFYQDGKLYGEKTYSKGILNGPFVFYYQEHALKMKGSMKEGFLEGDFETFYSNGVKKGCFSFKKGKKEGFEKRFWDNGALLLEVFYKEGKARGLLKEGNREGEIIREIAYNDEGHFISEKVRNEKGELVFNEKASFDYFKTAAEKTEVLTKSFESLNLVFKQLLSVKGMEREKELLNKEVKDFEQKKNDLLEMLLKNNEGIQNKEALEEILQKEISSFTSKLQDQILQISLLFK